MDFNDMQKMHEQKIFNIRCNREGNVLMHFFMKINQMIFYVCDVQIVNEIRLSETMQIYLE